MVHVHGRVISVRTAGGVPAQERIVVPEDAGKHTVMGMVAGFAGEHLVAPFAFSSDRPVIEEVVRTVERVVLMRDAGRAHNVRSAAS